MTQIGGLLVVHPHARTVGNRRGEDLMTVGPIEYLIIGIPGAGQPPSCAPDRRWRCD
jgi:hypothetical protein